MMALLARAAAYIAALFLTAPPSTPAPSQPLPAPTATPIVVTKAEPIKIMALGDSITAGVGPHGAARSDGGYRSALTRSLAAGGYVATMVGERRDFSADLSDPEHEGWPGYVLRSVPSDPAPQLLGDVTKRAVEGYHPDVILLMAGTNDLLRYARHSAGYSLDEIGDSLDLEVGQILSLDPSVRLIVAGVVDSPRVPHAAIIAFEERVSQCVSRYHARGYHIEQALGMSASVPRGPDYFPDGIHPSGGDGYALIGGVFYRAFGQALAAWPLAPLQAADKPTVANSTANHTPR